jgi:hypothetical protein
MKSLKVLCAIGMATLLFSCAYQEDTAAFFIENQLNEDLVILNVQGESTFDTNIEQGVTLDLTTSESYERYILRLTQLEITKFECIFSNYQGVIENGKLYLDDLLLGDFNPDAASHTVDDPALLSRISELFIERTSLDFYFVGESDTDHTLNVNINVEMKGTFVH